MGNIITLPDSELFVRYACHQHGGPAFFDREEYAQIEEGAELGLRFAPVYAVIDTEAGEVTESYPPREELEFTVSIQKIKAGELVAEMAMRRWMSDEDKPFLGTAIASSTKSISAEDELYVVAGEDGQAWVANISRNGSAAVLAYRQALENFGIR